MKNALRSLVIGTALTGTVLAAPGAIADARTAPAHTAVRYEWTSDMVQNQISYYASNGKQVTSDVRFRPLPVGFGPEKYAYSVNIRTGAKRQTYGAKAVSSGAFATCKITVNKKQVAYKRQLSTGRVTCR